MNIVLRKYLSIRPFQVDYMISQLTYHTQNQFRVSAGIVFRWKFGERRNAFRATAGRLTRCGRIRKKVSKFSVLWTIDQN